MQAEKAYRAYAVTGDESAIISMHTLANDLISAIACSLDQPTHYEDLCQEAHLKLQIIITKQKYRTNTRCSFYTFLSVALKNAMIDYMRKTQDAYELQDWAINCEMDDNYYVMDEELFRSYYQYRFPSLTNCYEVAEYIKDTILEHLRKPLVLNTLTSLYQLPRPRAIIMHNSVELFALKSSSLHLSDLVEPLSYAYNGKEFTLYPESVMVGAPGVIGYKKLLAYMYGRT